MIRKRIPSQTTSEIERLDVAHLLELSDLVVEGVNELLNTGHDVLGADLRIVDTGGRFAW